MAPVIRLMPLPGAGCAFKISPAPPIWFGGNDGVSGAGESQGEQLREIASRSCVSGCEGF
jgi:hypothetical protein